MKKLALLFLAPALAACTMPTPEQRALLKQTQLAEAQSACADNAHYWRCVNRFTIRKFGMRLERGDDGSTTLVNAAAPFPAGPDLLDFSSGY